MKAKLNYILEKEEGPSHCKVFCVKLDVLGHDFKETYVGKGWLYYIKQNAFVHHCNIATIANIEVLIY